MYAAANRLLRGAKRARPEAQGISKAAFRRFHRRWWRSRRLCWWPLSVASISLRIIRKKKRKRCKIAKAAGNGLPPKPEERWRYIKSWKAASGVRAPTEPTAGGEVMKPEQLTDEQRQLLAQMQADMRQQPTQLTEVPWNEQTPAQRQQTLQRQRLAQQQQQAQQQQWAQTQAQTVQQQPPRVQQPKPVQQQQPKQTASNQQPYQICCRRQRIPIPRSRVPGPRRR